MIPPGDFMTGHGQVQYEAHWGLKLFAPVEPSELVFRYFVALIVIAMALNAQQVIDAFNSADADLKFLMAKFKVDEAFQGLLFHAGITSSAAFAAMADEEKEMKDILKAMFNLDPAVRLEDLVKVANIKVAWSTAKTGTLKQAEVDADNAARNVPKIITSGTYGAMRSAFELKYYELDDDKAPGRTYIEAKLDDVERSEFLAENLSDVVAVTEDKKGSFGIELTAAGTFKPVRPGAKVELPRDPEQLRRRIGILGTAFIMVSTHQTNCVYLQGLCPQDFLEYVDYLLGKHCYGVRGRNGAGEEVGGPSWGLLLSYEQEMRAEALKMVRKGKTLKEALRAVVVDPIVKERFFSTPLAQEAVHGTKRAAPPPQADDSMSRRRTTKVKKGKGSGKGKNGPRAGGHAKAGKHGCPATSPDGRPLCFAFNAPKGCKVANCRFLHACGRCNSTRHGLTTCPN